MQSKYWRLLRIVQANYKNHFQSHRKKTLRCCIVVIQSEPQKRGTRSGKAIGRPAIPETIRIAIRDAYNARGKGLREVARQFGVGVETVRRCLTAA
jgi:hypothetical protein